MLDEENRRVLVNGQPLELTETEFSILHCLAENRGRVVPVRTIYETVWHEDVYAGVKQYCDGAYREPAQEAGGGSGQPAPDPHRLGERAIRLTEKKKHFVSLSVKPLFVLLLGLVLGVCVCLLADFTGEQIIERPAI